MAVSTEKIIPGVLPPKEETEGVDFLAIYDSFDASKLTDEQLEKFAPRDPYVTAWMGSEDEPDYYLFDGVAYFIPSSPIEERLQHAGFCVKSYRNEIEIAVEKWNSGDSRGYSKARTALIQAIGKKACYEYVKRQYDQMTDEQLNEDRENWDRWCRYVDKRQELESEHVVPDFGPPEGFTYDLDWRHDQEYIPLLSLKMQMLRKASGFTQRDFAKKIEYNVNKYALLEQGKLSQLGFDTLEEAFPADFLKKIVDLTYANPYWLEDAEEYTVDDVDRDLTAMTVDEAREPRNLYPMFADAKVIRYWWGHR